jgi:recombination associated protein RdgC
MRLMVEQKVLPSSVVKRRVGELARQSEKATGRKPGKRHAKELKEEATLALLPQPSRNKRRCRCGSTPRRSC